VDEVTEPGNEEFHLIRELLEKSEIVLEEQADVVHLVAQNRDALDAHPPRESGVPLRVVANVLEHDRMDHSASADLEPAGSLAHRTTGAVALPAADVHLGARLGVREKTRTEPQPR